LARRLLVSLSLGLLFALLFSPSSPVHAQSIDAGLVGYWPFDEGSGNSTVDRSGSGNNASLSAAASFTTSTAPLTVFNPAALTFRGRGHASAASNQFDTLQQFTLAAWVQQLLEQLWPGQSVTLAGQALNSLTSELNKLCRRHFACDPLILHEQGYYRFNYEALAQRQLSAKERGFY
jgi:hypothetical protein